MAAAARMICFRPVPGGRRRHRRGNAQASAKRRQLRLALQLLGHGAQCAPDRAGIWRRRQGVPHDRLQRSRRGPAGSWRAAGHGLLSGHPVPARLGAAAPSWRMHGGQGPHRGPAAITAITSPMCRLTGAAMPARRSFLPTNFAGPDPADRRVRQGGLSPGGRGGGAGRRALCRRFQQGADLAHCLWGMMQAAAPPLTPALRIPYPPG